MIPPELQAEILRLHHAEHWPPGTIAAQLGVHHSVVRRVLAQDGAPRAELPRTSKVDPFIPFLVATLKRYPRLSATRLYQMVRQRGYPGKEAHFRAIVARLRPPRAAEAYLRLKTLPGDEAQVDWAKFGKLRVGKAARPLVAFVMVLSYSRAIFLRFFPSEQLPHFLVGHEGAFTRWEGVPRTVLYDNLKSVVLERIGDAIRFNEQLLAFASHYRYAPRPVAPYRGNEKGRVERAIRYVRDNFFPARSFSSFADINRQAEEWANTVAMARAWPEDHGQSVASAFERDRAALRPLPGDSFPCFERKEARVGKTPYVRFDLNDYSVPHTATRRTVVIFATDRYLRIYDGRTEIARHPRSFDRDRQIEDPRHLEALAAQKRHARKSRATDVLAQAAPSSTLLLRRLAERHQALGSHARALLELLRTYGAAKLEQAIQEALAKDAPHPQAVRHVLERNREASGAAAALPLPLRPDPRLAGLHFTGQSLADYDGFHHHEEERDVAPPQTEEER